MLPSSHPIAELLRKDSRYTFDAYVFVFEALNYAQNVLGMGKDSDTDLPAHARERQEKEKKEKEDAPERHVSGQELCEAIRHFAVEQYGYMAKTVLNSWGVRATSDFGEIVFNLIRIGQMRKTPSDCREDFENIFDFDTAFRQEFRIRI